MSFTELLCQHAELYKADAGSGAARWADTGHTRRPEGEKREEQDIGD